ncbi:MAG: hypothetical protein CM1200mP20_13040 [Pseudomonadota bacterium]|nr:MAG: hypothetical protein CM1200mP20_13040 [Pseudomonadota bacterium]
MGLEIFQCFNQTVGGLDGIGTASGLPDMKGAPAHVHPEPDYPTFARTSISSSGSGMMAASAW